MAMFARCVVLAAVIVVIQIGGGYPTSRPLGQIERSVTRPVPRAPRTPPPPPAHVWVPDRYVPVPGVPGGLRVPGHWAERLPDGRYLAPPLVACRAGTADCRTIPGGVRETPEPVPPP